MTDKPDSNTPHNSDNSFRKNAEAALGKAEEIFRLLVDAVSDYAIFALDQNGYILTWNKGAQRLKGYLPSEIIGQHFSKFYTEVDIKRNHPAYELKYALANGKFEEEGWRIKKDGSVFWANVIINKLQDEQGNFLGFAKITRDLTERKKAEELLQQSEERQRLMIEGVKDYAIFMLNPKGIVASWNQGAERIKKYQASEIIGQHFSKFYSAEDLISCKPDQEIAVATELGRFEDEGWRVKKDGTRFWANVILTRIEDKNGKLLGFSKITRDLTERKINEEKLRTLNDELEKKVISRTQELTKIMRELQVAIKVRENFLSIASHELKTPLTSLKLKTQMRIRTFEKKSEESFKGSQIVQMAKDDETHINRLNRLVDDILDTTRIDAGKLGLELEIVELSSLIKNLIEGFMPQLESAECEITFHCEEEIKGLWDPYRLEQVFMNLMTNAVRYGGGKPIRVQLRTKDGYAQLSIQDQGIGISSEDRERIFQQFERATTVSEGKGLGLGLYIVRQIVEAHGGKIHLISSLGLGSTFTVDLPLNH